MKLLLENWRGYLNNEEGASHTEENIYGWAYSDLIKMMMSSESAPDEEDREYLIDHKAKELRRIEEQGEAIAYRVVFTKTEEDINLDELGHHFISDVSDFHESMLNYLYMNARKSDPTLKEEDVWLIKVKIPSNSIDYRETMRTFANFPFESEITVKNPENVEIIDISPYYEEPDEEPGA